MEENDASELHGRMKNSTDFQGLQHGADMFKIPFVHTFRFVFLAAEGLNLMNSGQIILKFSIQFSHFFLGDTEIWPDFFGENDS